MNQLQRVALWNTTAGKPAASLPLDHQLVQSQVGYVVEESEELFKAVQEKDIVELLDAIGDTLVTVGGLMHLTGTTEYFSLRLCGGDPDGFITTMDDESLFPKVDEIQRGVLQLKRQVSQEHSTIICENIISSLCGLADDLGFCPEAILKVVNDSNFTKFCRNPEDGKQTRLMYNRKDRYKNIRVNQVGNFWVVTGDDLLYNTKQKTLKSIYFEEPRRHLVDMVKEHGKFVEWIK